MFEIIGALFTFFSNYLLRYTLLLTHTVFILVNLIFTIFVIIILWILLSLDILAIV